MLLGRLFACYFELLMHIIWSTIFSLALYYFPQSPPSYVTRTCFGLTIGWIPSTREVLYTAGMLMLEISSWQNSVESLPTLGLIRLVGSAKGFQLDFCTE